MSRQLCQILWKTRVAGCAAIALLAAGCGFAQTTATEPEQLTGATLPRFLAEYEKSLNSSGAAFSELEKQKLPLFDESGRPLGRRNIQDRSKELVELRTDIERLRAKPGDLVLIMTFFNHNERLADEVYDLSQIAYDNDQEELGKQLTDLLGALDRDQDRIQAYALKVAATKEQRIEALEQENRDLQDRSKKSGGVRSGGAHSSQGDAER